MSFQLKTLSIKHLDAIHGLINNHFVEDDQHLIRSVFSRDFIYWYMQTQPMIIGVVLREKLIGIITASLVELVVKDQIVPTHVVNFFLVQRSVRKLGVGRLLITELQKKIGSKPVIYANTTNNSSFSKARDYILPINYQKLHEIGFLPEIKATEVMDNPLHLLRPIDLNQAVTKLNSFMKKFPVRFHFGANASHYLLPKKDIVYTFINKIDDKLTDIVVTYISYLYCLESHVTLKVANLAFYVYETMNLSQLISFTLDKLRDYEVDQLAFNNIADNIDINCPDRLASNSIKYYCESGLGLGVMPGTQLCLPNY